MNRNELINKGADAVRNTPHLFTTYKQFLIEDWGELPQGCFGCQFSSHFNQWKNQVLTNNIIPMENTVKPTKTYVLKDKSINKYLYGEVYSNYSPDEHWIKYLELKPEGKNLFMILPEGVSRTETDQETEEEYKKKDLNNWQMIEDVVGDEVVIDTDETLNEENHADSIIDEDNAEQIEDQPEETTSPVIEDVVEEKPKRGRKSQD